MLVERSAGPPAAHGARLQCAPPRHRSQLPLATVRQLHSFHSPLFASCTSYAHTVSAHREGPEPQHLLTHGRVVPPCLLMAALVTFLVGAVFFSIIYGNIGQFMQALWSPELRFRAQMEEIDRFCRFYGADASAALRCPALPHQLHHCTLLLLPLAATLCTCTPIPTAVAHAHRIPTAFAHAHRIPTAFAYAHRMPAAPVHVWSQYRWSRRISTPAVHAGIAEELEAKIRAFVKFERAVTRGISLESMARRLPAHLVLEIRLCLHRPMLKSVAIFREATDAFIEELVHKLTPLTSVQGEVIFYGGEYGGRMFFVQRGEAHVMRGGEVLKALVAGEYFGEVRAASNAAPGAHSSSQLHHQHLGRRGSVWKLVGACGSLWRPCRVHTAPPTDTSTSDSVAQWPPDWPLASPPSRA